MAIRMPPLPDTYTHRMPMRMPCYDRPLPDTYTHTPATLYRMPMRITLFFQDARISDAYAH